MAALFPPNSKCVSKLICLHSGQAVCIPVHASSYVATLAVKLQKVVMLAIPSWLVINAVHPGCSYKLAEIALSVDHLLFPIP